MSTRMSTEKIYSDALASLKALRDLYGKTEEYEKYEKIQKMMDDISDKWIWWERNRHLATPDEKWGLNE